MHKAGIGALGDVQGLQSWPTVTLVGKLAKM